MTQTADSTEYKKIHLIGCTCRTDLNWFMPAFTNIRLGSLKGTTGLARMCVWSLSRTKKSKNWLRTAAAECCSRSVNAAFHCNNILWEPQGRRTPLARHNIVKRRNFWNEFIVQRKWDLSLNRLSFINRCRLPHIYENICYLILFGLLGFLRIDFLLSNSQPSFPFKFLKTARIVIEILLTSVFCACASTGCAALLLCIFSL